MTNEPTAKEIDAGAEALRQHEQGGRILRPWDVLPNSDKKKWRVKSQLVLRAASDQEGPATQLADSTGEKTGQHGAS